MHKALLLTTLLAPAAAAQQVDLNLSSVTRDGGPTAFNEHYVWGGSETTLSATGETEHYTPGNVSTGANGITLTAQPNGTSGAITSATETNGKGPNPSYGMPQPGGFSMTYGTVNITAKMPVGKGLWPAVWLMPIKPGVACEIDINEAPFNDPNKYQASLHDGTSTGYTTSVDVPDMTKPNTYGVSVQPDFITYLLNGKPVGSVPTPPQCNTPLYLLANVAMGGWAGNPDGSTPFPAAMTISRIAYTPGPYGTFSGGLANGASIPPSATAPTIAPPLFTSTTPPGGLSPTPTQVAGGDLKPYFGAVTDCHGNSWTITASGSVMENTSYVSGGGGTAALEVIGCDVFGKDNGHGPINPGGWFKLSGDGQAWSPSGAPPGQSTPPSQRPSLPNLPLPPPTGPVGLGLAPQYSCGTSAPNSDPSHGGFGTIGGQIYTPDGKPFIARGINVRSSELGDITSGAVTALFPNVNFVRINVRALDRPESLAPAINYLTSKGIVAELEDHPDGGGDQDAWSSEPGDVAWYGQVAAYYKNNPYVWFGTFNEPNPANLSAWEKATYDAIRGTGNGNPILLEPSGSRAGNLQQALNPADFAGMENTIWDPHVYGYQTNGSTDQGTNNANVAAMAAAAQTIKGADGTMPVIIGEYGDSTDGSNTDGNGMQNVKGVINSGYGSAAWSWISGGSDMLQSGGSLTAYGRAVADFIKNSGATGCNTSPDPTLIPTAETIPAPPNQGDALTPQNTLANIQPPAGMN